MVCAVACAISLVSAVATYLPWALWHWRGSYQHIKYTAPLGLIGIGLAGTGLVVTQIEEKRQTGVSTGVKIFSSVILLFFCFSFGPIYIIIGLAGSGYTLFGSLQMLTGSFSISLIVAVIAVVYNAIKRMVKNRKRKRE